MFLTLSQWASSSPSRLQHEFFPRFFARLPSRLPNDSENFSEKGKGRERDDSTGRKGRIIASFLLLLLLFVLRSLTLQCVLLCAAECINYTFLPPRASSLPRALQDSTSQREQSHRRRKYPSGGASSRFRLALGIGGGSRACHTYTGARPQFSSSLYSHIVSRAHFPRFPKCITFLPPVLLV